MKRGVFLAVAGALVVGALQAGPVRAHVVAQDPLKFFKNYFVTGDYAVAGVGLVGQGVNGLASGSIEMQGVPEGVDVAAAFLYWQVIATDAAGGDAGNLPVTFHGKPLRSADGPFGKQLGSGSGLCFTASAAQATTGTTGKTYAYRADVLRYLDVDQATGKYVVNGSHPVQLPDDGVTTAALGASLVVVYRDPALPLSAIVIYDGGFTMGSSETMTQRIQGFYDPATTAAKMSFVMGSGQASKSERLTFSGDAVAVNPFKSAQGLYLDNPTFNVSSPLGLATVTAGIDHVDVSLPDCVTGSALIYKTEVKDTDGDGLLDAWENNRASSPAPLVDPNGTPLPFLGDMGANPAQKDVFMEVGYMDAGAQAYGGVAKPAHSHLPSHEALKLMGDAFKNAPQPIAVHFDLGNGYPAGDPLDPKKNADEYIIRGAGLARGGEQIAETATVCQRGPTDAPWVCQFSEFPGTVGWKTGFRYLRDEVLSVTPPSGMPAPPPGEDFCDTPGYTCNRRFDENRKDMFRYALFAHAIGLPKSEQPCLDANDQPVEGDSNTGLCTAPLTDNPGFHAPRTNTGVGDFPGGDVMVTLGAFNDLSGLPVGTPFMQASTLMHEFGHNAERRHGGEAFAPNCTPTYLSVMNYLYQLRGLLDDSGTPHLDFSRQAISPAIDETSLFDGSHANLPYRIGYYAPLAGSYLQGFGSPVARHCDGSDLVATDVPMVRIDARFAAAPVDWNANNASDAGFVQDVNFNGRTLTGTTPEVLSGSDDWSRLLLNQAGSRRNTGGLYVDSDGHLVVGALSLDSGRGDLGRGDLGRGDLGRGDLGRGDLGRGDLGRGDLGRGDLGRGDLGNPALGRGDLGRGDLGGGDLFLNDPDNPSGELDFDIAVATAKAPPNEFSACVIGVNCAETTPLHRVRLAWKAPHEGNVGTFSVYKVAGAALVPGATWLFVQQVPFVAGQEDYSALDTSALADGAPFTYFAIATYADGTRSDPSNLVTVTGVNDAPTAGPDSYATNQGTALSVAAPGVLANDSDADSAALTAVLVTGPAHGTLSLNANGSFTYTPAAGFAGSDAFTYGATDGQRTTNATVSIEVRAVIALYGFIGVQNLPATKSVNAGSAVPLRWQFTRNGVVVDSSAAQPQITIRNAAGVVVAQFRPEDPGASGFQPPTAPSWTWGYNWQTKGLAKGTYQVFVGSQQTGQVYSAGTAFGPFAVTLK